MCWRARCPPCLGCRQSQWLGACDCRPEHPLPSLSPSVPPSTVHTPVSASLPSPALAPFLLSDSLLPPLLLLLFYPSPSSLSPFTPPSALPPPPYPFSPSSFFPSSPFLFSTALLSPPASLLCVPSSTPFPFPTRFLPSPLPLPLPFLSWSSSSHNFWESTLVIVSWRSKQSWGEWTDG